MGVNPTKRNRFQVIEADIIVLDPAAIHSITIPNVDIQSDDHVENNHIRSTPTIINVEEFEIKFYEDQAIRNNWYLAKIPYNQETGAILDPEQYEFDLVIQMLAYDGETPIREFTCKACGVRGGQFETLERLSNLNQMRTVRIKPHRMIERPL